MAIKLIRIENPIDSLGFYRSYDFENEVRFNRKHSKIKEIDARHCKENVLPGYRQDETLQKHVSYSEIENYRFGFLSLEQLKRLFLLEELKEVIEIGFKIYSIEVSAYIRSDYQVIFKPEHIISKEDISYLFT